MRTTGVVYEFDTPFGHYRVTDTYYTGRPARLLYSGNNDAAQSGVAYDDNDDLLFDYNQRFRELVQGINPQSLLLLGGGTLTLPTALRREFPELRLDVVELDACLVEVARNYFDFQDDALTTVHIGDGSEFLASSSHTYDMILVDVYMHATIPDAFQTLEFIQNAHRHLNKKGVVAMNVIASLQGRRSKVLRRLLEVMQATFLGVQLFPAARDVSPWLPQNYVLTAQNGTHDLISHLRYSPLQVPPLKILF